MIGTRQSGDDAYQPVMAEKNENERRFTALGHRQMILWDRMKGTPPQVWQTPPLSIGQPEQGQLDMFEAAHMQLTGVPAAQIRAEIVDRQERIRQMFLSPSERIAGQPEYGGPL